MDQRPVMDLECSSKRTDNGEQELNSSSSTEDDASVRTQNCYAIEDTPSANIPQQSLIDVSSKSPTRDVAAQHVANGFLSPQPIQNGTRMDFSITVEDDKKREHKRRSKNWTRAETLKLIEMRTDFDERFQRTGKKAMLWEEIAIAMQKDKFSRDGQQCKDKWEKLTAAYKEVRDGTRETSEHPFYNELNALLSWKLHRKEVDGGNEDGDQKRAKFELKNSPSFLSWNQGGVSYALNPHLPAIGMTEVRFDRGFGGLDLKEERQTYGVNSMEMNENHRRLCSSPKKQKREEETCSFDWRAVQELLDSIIARQQVFFKDLLDALDRKERLKEQMRHEREDKWREEERAQRFAFNSMMIRLTQRLLGERPLAMEVVPSHLMVPTTSNGVVYPKKRSKNWKKSEVTNLIRVRQEMESKFLMSTRRAALWEELGEKLSALGTHRDGKQCREKWDKLMAEYKDVMDGRKEKDESIHFEQFSCFMATGKGGDSKAPADTLKEEGAASVKDETCAGPAAGSDG